MLTEADWQRRQFVPTVEEYMANAVSSFALAVIILPAQYFLGETLSDYMVKDHEYSKLSELMFTCSRLLNDIRSVEVYAVVSPLKQNVRRPSVAMKLNMLLHAEGVRSW